MVAQDVNVSVESISSVGTNVSVQSNVDLRAEAIQFGEPGVDVRVATPQTITLSSESILSAEPSPSVAFAGSLTIGNQLAQTDILEPIRYDLSHDRITVEWRAHASELSKVRTFKDRAGDVSKLTDSDGGWEGLDRSNSDNEFTFNPPVALQPPLISRDVVVSNYREQPEPSGLSYRVTADFLPTGPRELSGSAPNATADSDEWLFEFSNGDIATNRVSVYDEGRQGDVTFELRLTDAQCEVLLDSPTYVDAVSIERVPDGNDFVRDNNPNNRNTVTISRPTDLSTDYLPDEGDYAVRSWDVTRTGPPYWEARFTARKT